MKTLHTLLTMTAWIVCLTACNDDLEGGNATNKPSNSVYMKFSVDLPTTASSRSATNTGKDDDYVTSEDGTEVGKDRENNISEIIMVLADAETNAYITSTELIRTTPGNGEPNEDNEIENLYTVPIPLDEMEGNESKTVNVYLYCNPTQDIVNTFSTTVTDFTDKSYTVAESETDEKDAGIWTDDHFLMTNAVMHTLKLPDSWNDYRTYSNPVDLGNIKVERSAARFDYKKVYTDNKYPVVKENAQNNNETDNPGVFIQLNDIALINMSKSFYYLRRVSDDGLNTNAELCGVEYVNNYVVDTDATQKSTYSTGGWADKKSNFYYNLEEPDTWAWTSLASLSEEDNWGSKTGEKEGYYIWRYAVENTIPAPVANQQNGISTGVAFRAQIVAGENCDKTLKETLDEGTEDIYVFQNKLYGDWDAVETAAEADLTSELGYAYQAVTDGGYSYEDAGFTVYKPTDGKYITYYYYWNRHNDNNKSTEMGPMEFAVVRNNVYKLSVEAIYRFGSDDPKPEIPDEHPEEEPDNVFFKVNVKVLPWVVRVNEIVFD